MNEVKKSVLSAAVVVAAAGAVVVGASVRNQKDLGGAGDPTLVAGVLHERIASKQSRIEVPAGDYFAELSEKLKREYVEPINDEMKLASGSVRGMVASLADPKSFFMNKQEFQAYLEARQGRYQGIGVDVALELPKGEDKTVTDTTANPETNETSPEEALALGLRIPRVVVTNVVPGGPADKAGVKVGDVAYSIDGHWVANGAEVAQFRQAQLKFQAKQMSAAEYNELRKEIRKKTEGAIMPLKAKERLVLGKSGSTEVVWERGGQKVTTKMNKAIVEAPRFAVNGNVIRLPLTPGVAKDLKAAIEGKSAITLDLRNNVGGDYQTMRECLAVLAPAGRYGTLATQKKESAPQYLQITTGNPSPPQITLLVDRSTSGAAEILAMALSSRQRAKLTGGKMGGDRTVRQIVQLPDGTGYTLVTGEYRPQVQNSVVAQGGSR